MITTFTNYEIISQIGSGNYGKVYLAKLSSSSQQVALKVLNTKNAKDDLLRILNSERFAMERLRGHRNIVQLEDYFTIDNNEKTIFVMEYVSGGDLREYVNLCGHLNEFEAVVIFSQLITAIQFSHAQGIVHRDIKLENILLDQHRTVKLADWGLSTEWRIGQYRTEYVGSVHYVAPEMLNGTPYIGPEVDVWSLGVVLYAMVCGKLPFQEDPQFPHPLERSRDLRRRIRRAEFSFPRAELSLSCQQLIRQMLEVDVTKRITIPGILHHPWIIASSVNPAMSRFSLTNSVAEANSI